MTADPKIENKKQPNRPASVDDLVGYTELESSEQKQLVDSFQPSRMSLMQRLKKLAKMARAYFAKHKVISLIIIGVALLIVLVGCFRSSRLFALNQLGVRSDLTVTVVDRHSGNPLAGAKVSLNGVNAKTNYDGKATLGGIRLGDHTLRIENQAYAELDQKVEINSRRVKLGPFEMNPTGRQFKVKVVDYLSSLPLPESYSSYLDSVVRSSSQGIALLTVDASDLPLDVAITKNGYKSAKLRIEDSSANQLEVKLVPDYDYVYLDRDQGQWRLYKIGIDGQNRQLLTKALALNSLRGAQLMRFADLQTVAVVSNKDNIEDDSGRLLDALSLVDVRSGADKTIDRAEAIKLIGFDGNWLVYELLTRDNNNQPVWRYISYDAKSGERHQLAESSNLLGGLMIDNRLYYVEGGSAERSSLFMEASIYGGGSQLLLKDEIKAIKRSDYYVLNLLINDKWQTYDTKVYALGHAGPDTTADSSLFVPSPGGDYVITTVGQADKLAIIDLTNSQSQPVVIEGIVNPVAASWVSLGSLVVSSMQGNQLIDYVVSLDLPSSPKELFSRFY